MAGARRGPPLASVQRHQGAQRRGQPGDHPRRRACHIWDSDGNRILDGMAGLWCVNIGYGRKELAEVAYRQMQDLAFYNCFFKTTHPAAAELAARIAAVAPPHMNRVFFTGSGSESNDTVLRLVRRYWDVMGAARAADGDQPLERLSRQHHGRRQPGRHEADARPGRPADPGHRPHPPALLVRRGPRHGPDEFGLVCARALEDKILELGPENVAAFIGEPVQGAGGVIIPPRQLLARDPAHLPQVRHPPGRRRGDLRLRPARRPGSARSISASSPT